MPKRGALFERAVKDILESFAGVSDVEQGTWKDGPYGRRDRDVGFSVNTPTGETLRGLIECKDYNPRTTGKVGIELIDALDSKRRDLDVCIAMICSNAGFTQPALTKAFAVGITAVGALRKGDHRIKFQVGDVMFVRKLVVPSTSLTVGILTADGAPMTTEMHPPIDQVTFEGRRVADWLISRIPVLLASNPIVNGHIVDDPRFNFPVTLQVPDGTMDVIGFDFEFDLRGAWYRHLITFDSTNGFYNWARKRPRTAAREFVLQLRIDLNGGSLVTRPPDYVLRPLPLLPGELDEGFVKLNCPLPGGPLPDLDRFLSMTSKSFKLVGEMAEALYTSTHGFQPEL